MTLAYLPRLLCLCLAMFFLLNAACTLLVRALSSSALQISSRRNCASAARLLLAVRLFPLALTTIFVLFLCVPSYVRLEPAAASEYVGLPCLTCALLGALNWSLALARAARALWASLRHHRSLAKRASKVLFSSGYTALYLDTDAPVLALSGLLRPCILISRSVFLALSPAELEAAFSHEQAHRASRDNLKRLLLVLAPDILPFIDLFRTMDHAWVRFAEWAADDHAASTNPNSAVSLASALVRVARLGTTPALPYLSTSLLPADDDLSARVDRLLDRHSAVPVPMSRTGLALRLTGALAAVCLAAALFAPSALSLVHELQELLLR